MESVTDFSARIKSKYPDYAEIPDADLVSRILDKHPEYKDVVDLSHPDNGQGAGGMGDVKMAESPAGTAPQPYQPPDYIKALNAGAQPGAWSAAKAALQFAGDVGNIFPMGAANAAVQGVQDNWGHPLDILAGIAGNELKNIASPFHTFEKPIQSSSESLQRMGVPNTPMAPPMRYPGEIFPGGNAPMAGLADQAGTAADIVGPLVGVEAIKAAGAASRAALDELANGAGTKLQDFAIGQSKSIVPFLTRHIRDGANPETLFKEDLMGPKDQIFDKAKALRKDLGGQLGQLIQEGKDNGVTVNGLDEIDKLVAPHLEDPGASIQSARITDPASQKFIRKAKTFVTRLSPNKDGVLNLKQAQTVKQWLQKQAEYTGPADAAGIPLVAAPSEASQTAADLGHHFKTVIEDVAPDGIKEINQRLNKIYPVERAAGWRQMIRDRQPPVSIKDYMGLGQLLTSPIWLASKAYGSGRVAKAIYNIGAKLKGTKTLEEAARNMETLKRLGMSESDLNDGSQMATLRRVQATRLLKATTGGEPTNAEIYKYLSDLGEKPVPKPPEKPIVSREFYGRRPTRDLDFLQQAIKNGTEGYPTKSVSIKDAPEKFTLHGTEFKKAKSPYDNLILYKDAQGQKYEFKGDEKIHMDWPKNEVPF